MTDIKLKCKCWKVTGLAHKVSVDNWNRIICHCTDCQSFAEYLKNEVLILDNHKWTDIFQMPLSNIEIISWKESIKCIKLSDKWLYRWYADCCKTPIGNTMTSKANFIWVVHNFMDIKNRDEVLWPVRAFAFLKTNTSERQATPLIKMLPRMFLKILGMRFQKWKEFSDFFDNNWVAIFEPEIIKISN